MQFSCTGLMLTFGCNATLFFYVVRHTDFYDLRSKTIIKNRLVLDKLLAESAIEKLITHPETTPSDSQVTAVVPLPRPIREDFSESPKKRYLRSNDNGVPFSTKLLSSKPESYRVKLLLTVPHIVSVSWFKKNPRLLTPSVLFFK